MKIIGVTGSSGSGKTSVCKLLNEYDYIKVIDVDKVAREMAVPGTIYFEKIIENFGKEILLEDGTLNRKFLASKIYNDNSRRSLLNSLTFKYVLEEVVRKVEENKKENVEITVIDAALLFESNLNNICDYIIAVTAKRELKLRRICLRDNLDIKTAEARLNIQNEDSYYEGKVDFIIKNNEENNLKSEIVKILKSI